MRQLTQVTLLVRLVGLAAGLLALTGTRVSFATMVGFLVVGATSLFGLLNTSVLDLARRHPLIAMADAVLLAAIVAVNGIDSPLLLAALTTALLLGLWLEPVSGALVMVCRGSCYGGAALLGADGTAPVFTAWVTIPFVYVTLWLLGLTMRRSLESEARAQATLRDAVTTAAATEERTKVCLLYTSDAADERSSVDLGGRRIIKKKKRLADRGDSCLNTTNKARKWQHGLKPRQKQ